MRSNAGIANRQGDVNLRFAQVSAHSQHFGWDGFHVGWWLEMPEVRENLTCLSKAYNYSTLAMGVASTSHHTTSHHVANLHRVYALLNPPGGCSQTAAQA